MKGNRSKDDEIERLKHARDHGVSGVEMLQQQRRKTEAAEARRAKKHQGGSDDEDFVDDAVVDETTPALAKQLQKIKHVDAEEEYEQDQPAGANGALLTSIARMKPAAPKPKKVNEKDVLASQNLMNELFEELDKAPVAPVRASTMVAEVGTSRHNPNRMDEEVPAQQAAPTFEDELEELEQQMHQMDVEAPAAAPVNIVSSTPQHRPASSMKATLTTEIRMSDREMLSFARNLYTHQRGRYFDLSRSLKDEQAESVRVQPKLFNGKIHFYWMDIQEEFRKKSLVHLYGKVRLENGQCASACLTVENMQRTYYFVKRAQTDNPITLQDLANEVSQKIQKRHPQFFKEVKINEVKDKYYAFELDIARGQVEAIEVTYSFDHAPLEVPFEGDTYKGIIGKTYKTTELFVINNRLMGPCWLEVENCTRLTDREYSTCEYEFRVKSSLDVEAADSKEAGDPPRCKLVSMSLLKDKDGANEIRAIAAFYYNNYDVENVQNDLKLVPVVFIQVKPDSISLYRDMLKRCFGENVYCLPSEHALINAFAMFFNKLDPDIIVGHDTNNLFFEPFISRVERTNQIGILSRLSRSNRDAAEMRRAIKTFGLKKIRAASYGRMVCDTLLCSQEHIRETNYELDYLAEKHLGEQNIYAFRAANSDEFKMTIHSIDEHLMSAHLALNLCQKLQLIQLNKQLTNVAGCFWYQSFHNMRAERNEMLLMHTFYRSNYIFPDKYQTKWDESKKGRKRDKAKYEGGLVLEPKSGLYQDIILLLDFNSLYPSIIREYKICFTTVQRDYVEIDFYESNGNTKVPNLNDEDDGDGDAEEELDKLANTTRIPDHDAQSIEETAWNQILPKIIMKLINKRKEVKAQAKHAKSDLEKDTLDIKQKAYKLIANSIYGCLGFKNSRFYSRQMAALITYYGRNTLQKTAQKVAELQYDVIYGDTDSLMINSKQRDLVKAIEEGFNIKKAINKNSKILEIDVDGIFRSLLLLKKKKYAAIKLQNLDEVKKTLKPNEAKFRIELKGLDIVRRDWSGLTKMCGDYLVQQILNIEMDVDDIISNIYRYFTNFMVELKTNKIGLDAFIIYKQLTKNLSEYNDKGQPHVVVAKRMKSEMNYTNEQLVNHFIPYVICEGTGNKVGTSFSERAYHPDEVKKLGLKPDIKWYTNNQLMNPVVRLIEYLPGFSTDRLADILEIEKHKMSQAIENKVEGGYVHEEGTSVLYAIDEVGGSTVEWRCPEGHRNLFRTGETSLQCVSKKADGTQCGKFTSIGAIKNMAVNALRAQMMEYNNSVFAFQKKMTDQTPNSSSLPITEVDFATEQEQALADAVTRANTRLNNLEKLFDDQKISQSELKGCFAECKKNVSTLREQSQYSKVNFGAMCSKVMKERQTCRHYQFIGDFRPKLTK